MLDDVVRVVDVNSVKVDARERARVRDAVEDRGHAATGTAPVRPEIDDGDAIRVDLYSRREEMRQRKRIHVASGCRERCELTMLLNCVSEDSGTTVMIAGQSGRARCPFV